MGRALREIRDDKHYKDLGLKRFEDYCRQKWGLAKSQIHRQIEPARTVDVILSPKGDKNGKSIISDSKSNKIPLSTTPLTERAVRPIASSGLTDDQIHYF